MSSKPQRATDPVAYLAELLAAFHIGPDDLAANRAGHLGAAQRARMRRGIVTNMLLAIGLVVVLGGLILLTADRPIQWWRWVLIVVLAAACLAVGVFQSRNLSRAVDAGVIEIHHGPVRLHLQARVGWWLTVQGVSFHLPVKFWHVGDGLAYWVYVAPAARLIVAMEPDLFGLSTSTSPDTPHR